MKKNNIFKDIDTITIEKAREYNVLALAFIGDSVHTLYVRTRLILKNNIQSGKLHKLSSDYVKASAQSSALDYIYTYLDNEEISVVNRARNAKNKTFAKNASILDYNKSTAFESLIGFLYITGQESRLDDILCKAYGSIK